jgi:hypothetical protein
MANGPYELLQTFRTDPFEEQRIAAERQRRMAELLAQQSEQFGQYQTPSGPLGQVQYPVSQGLAQLATAIGGAFKRGRTEREEAALREQERAARTEANKFMSDVISGRYELPTDQTLSDTALPGELPTARDMSILERMQAGLPNLSEAAQSYVSPFAQQLGLSEAMSQQERQRDLEDFAAREAIEAQLAPPPEYNTVTVREGNEQVTYAINPTDPTQRMEIARGAAFPPNAGGGAMGQRPFQQSEPMRLADGRVVQTRYNPNIGEYQYQNEDGQYVAVPSDARPTTAGAGGTLNAKQFIDLRMEYLTEEQALNRMNEYFNTIGDMNIGFKNLADQVSGSIKTLFDTGEYTPEEISRQVAQGQLQGLLGLFRTEIVGPGVMTEYDAQRVINALGGNVGALTNPQIVEPLLRQLYQDKQLRSNLLRQEVERNAPVYGYEVPPPLAPSEFGGNNDAGAPPPGIDPEDWQYMPTEERALWQ